MMNKIKKLTPPGHKVEEELLGYLCIFLLVFIYASSVFFTKFNEGFRCMFFYDGHEKIFFDDAVMPELNYVMAHCMTAFWGIAADALLAVAEHYRSFRRESKSIYLMKRIPDRWDIHRRSIALPFLAILTGIIFCALLTLIFRGYYFRKVPAQCLPLDTSLDIWRLIL